MLRLAPGMYSTYRKWDVTYHIKLGFVQRTVRFRGEGLPGIGIILRAEESVGCGFSPVKGLMDDVVYCRWGFEIGVLISMTIPLADAPMVNVRVFRPLVPKQVPAGL